MALSSGDGARATHRLPRSGRHFSNGGPRAPCVATVALQAQDASWTSHFPSCLTSFTVTVSSPSDLSVFQPLPDFCWAWFSYAICADAWLPSSEVTFAAPLSF